MGEDLIHNIDAQTNKQEENNSYDRTVPFQVTPISKNLHFIPHSSEGGNSFSKPGCCPYCFQVYNRLDRHLMRVHKSQKTVKTINSLPKRNQKRMYLLSLLRKKGNENFNTNLSLNPTGKIIPVRRLAINRGKPLSHLKKKKISTADTSTEEQLSDVESGIECEEIIKNSVTAAADADRIHELHDFENKNKEPPKKPAVRLMCPICKGFYAKVAKHMKNQHSKREEMSQRGILALSKKELSNYPTCTSNRMRKNVLPYLRDDKVGIIAQSDVLIILYENKFSERHTHVDQIDLIKGHTRLLAKLLLELQDLSPNIDKLEIAFRGIYWDKVLSVYKSLSKYNEKTEEIENCYNARTLGMMLDRLITIVRARYRMHENKEKLEFLDTFEALFKGQYSAYILSKATLTENKKKRAGVESLPLTEDLNTLNEYIFGKIKTCVHILEKKFNFEAFKGLSYSLIISLQLYNNRRAGEIDRLTIDDYKQRKKADPKDDFYRTMNVKDKKQANRYERIDGQGKKINGLDSHTYISKFEIYCINLLIKLRKEAGISKDNNFLFALPSSLDGRLRHVSACVALTKLKKECNKNYKKIEKPEAITGIKLRKRLATKFSVLNQKENLNDVTDHLAHTVRTHKGYYRQKNPVIDVGVTEVLDRLNCRQNPLHTSDESTEHFESYK